METILVLHGVLGVLGSVLGKGILGEDGILIFRRVLGILGRILEGVLEGDGVLKGILDVLTTCVDEASLRVLVPDVLIDRMIGVHACNAFLLRGVLILVLDLLEGVLGRKFLEEATLLKRVLTWSLLGKIVGFLEMLEMLRSRIPACLLVKSRLS